MNSGDMKLKEQKSNQWKQLEAEGRCNACNGSTLGGRGRRIANQYESSLVYIKNSRPTWAKLEPVSKQHKALEPVSKQQKAERGEGAPGNLMGLIFPTDLQGFASVLLEAVF